MRGAAGRLCYGAMRCKLLDHLWCFWCKKGWENVCGVLMLEVGRDEKDDPGKEQVRGDVALGGSVLRCDRAE